MTFVRLHPPGTWCTHQTIFDLLRGPLAGKSFIEVGCGAGYLAEKLCAAGMTGVGVDFSPLAIQAARRNLASRIINGQIHLHEGDITDLHLQPADFAISLMVMEHVEDDRGFAQKLRKLTKPGGQVLVGVPGRKDCWGIEDETAGHYRRYDRCELERLLRSVGLRHTRAVSSSVPVSNALFAAGEALIRRSSETAKAHLSLRAQTEASGLQDIPYKTMFPKWCGWLLNRWTMLPFTTTQRFFYHTNLGFNLLATGVV
jgi:SAM-dependent methyltransferase